MKQRRVSKNGPMVSAMGLGCMSMSEFYGPRDDAESGRGFLTGQIKGYEDLAEEDYRRQSSRFQGENFERNLELVSTRRNNRKRKTRHAFTACAALGARPGRRCDPDSRNEKTLLFGGECRGRRRNAHRERAEAHRRGGVPRRSQRPALPGGDNEVGQRLIL
jgi:hypothetical protein